MVRSTTVVRAGVRTKHGRARGLAIPWAHWQPQEGGTAIA